MLDKKRKSTHDLSNSHTILTFLQAINKEMIQYEKQKRYKIYQKIKLKYILLENKLKS